MKVRLPARSLDGDVCIAVLSFRARETHDTLLTLLQ